MSVIGRCSYYRGVRTERFDSTACHMNGWPPMRRCFRPCQLIAWKHLLAYFPNIIIILSYVTDKPAIIVHPESQTKTEGENVTFSCNATGNPVPTISWTRNGSYIETSDNSRISFSANKIQLIITNLNRTESGEYLCVANNSVGNDISNTATLDVQCKYSVLFYFIEIQVPFSLVLSWVCRKFIWLIKYSFDVYND